MRNIRKQIAQILAMRLDELDMDLRCAMYSEAFDAVLFGGNLTNALEKIKTTWSKIHNLQEERRREGRKSQSLATKVIE